MAKTIPQLTDATTVNAADELIIQQGGITKRATRNELMTFEATGATTPRLIDDRFADVVNVKDFGAVGDGVTDDTAAIQAAIDVVGTRGGGTVDFPSGIYNIHDTLNVNSNSVVLKGVSATQHASPAQNAFRWSNEGGTIIRYTGTTDANKRMILMGATSTAAKGVLGCGISNLVLDADGKAGYGLEILSMRGGTFRNLAVADATVCNIRIAPQPAAGWTGVAGTGAAIRDTQHLVFTDLVSRSWLSAAENATGLLVEGDTVADSNIINFDKVFYVHTKGTGVHIKSSGSLYFASLQGFRADTTKTVTVSSASPAVVTSAGHGLSNGSALVFTSTGSLPSGISTSTQYFVRNATTDTFTLSRDYEGDVPVNTTSTGTGTHTVFAGGIGVHIEGGNTTAGAADDPTQTMVFFVEPSRGGFVVSNGVSAPKRVYVASYAIGNGSPIANVSDKAHAIITEQQGVHTLAHYVTSAALRLRRVNIGTVNNANTGIGVLDFIASTTTAGLEKNFARITGGAFNNSEGSLLGYYLFQTTDASGNQATELAMRDGIVCGAAGNLYGRGTINATAYHLGSLVNIRSGTGSPESNVTAPVGSLWLRTNGGASTTLYVKESGTGNTGWVAK
jgi:hypothetical protein